MNIKFGDNSFWLRLGRLGISVVPATEDTIDCFNIARAQVFGAKLAVLWMAP